MSVVFIRTNLYALGGFRQNGNSSWRGGGRKGNVVRPSDAAHVANRFASYVRITTHFPQDLAKIPGYTRRDPEPLLPKCLA